MNLRTPVILIMMAAASSPAAAYSGNPNRMAPLIVGEGNVLILLPFILGVITMVDARFREENGDGPNRHLVAIMLLSLVMSYVRVIFAFTGPIDMARFGRSLSETLNLTVLIGVLTSCSILAAAAMFRKAVTSIMTIGIVAATVLVAVSFVKQDPMPPERCWPICGNGAPTPQGVDA